MGILNLNRLGAVSLVVFLLFSCQSREDAGKRLENAKKECLAKTKIDGLNLNFIGYPYEEINNIKVIIYGTQKKTFALEVSRKISDSLRLLRLTHINHSINLKDTILLNFPNKEQYILTDFEYVVRPHFSMMSKNWGCDFYKMKINGVIDVGGSATFVKKGFEIRSKE